MYYCFPVWSSFSLRCWIWPHRDNLVTLVVFSCFRQHFSHGSSQFVIMIQKNTDRLEINPHRLFGAGHRLSTVLLTPSAGRLRSLHKNSIYLKNRAVQLSLLFFVGFETLKPLNKQIKWGAKLLKHLYSAVIQSVLCTSISVWVQTGEKLMTADNQDNLPSIQELYMSRVWKHPCRLITACSSFSPEGGATDTRTVSASSIIHHMCVLSMQRN